MDTERENPGVSPTAAVGSQPQNSSGPPDATTFSMEQVMGLLTSITRTAATSAARATLSTETAPLRRHHDFYLPPFNPDERSHDIRDWCANVDETIRKLNISPHEARMKAILQLRGRAKTWADTWSLHSTTWEQVKEELTHTFGNEFRYADDVQKWRSYTSDQASSYAEYATTAWTLFRRVRPEATDADVVDALITDTDLTNDTQIKEIYRIINEFKDNFTSGNRVSQVTTGELKIRLKNPDKIVQRRPYRLSPLEREKVRDIIKDLKENGIIRDSSSPFSSPILLVKKKDGTDRLCVDFRELNSNTVRDNYPLPLIADQIDRLGKARYYSCLDMASGFHGIPIAEDSIEKTAFVTPDGQFEYLRMPFGLCNAPSVYQRAINAALGDYRDNIALVYVDDILVVSESVQQELSRPWHTALQELQLAINCTVSKSTGKSPMELLLGKRCYPPAIKILQIDDDILTDNLEEVRSIAKKRMDERSLSDKTRFDKEKIANHDALRPAPIAQSDPFNDSDNSDELTVWAEESVETEEYGENVLSSAELSGITVLWKLSLDEDEPVQ
ncbi:uncharacterized protein LOC120636835 [Pararge aegeria]|uniref:uncharacterized protein LOC120636835 n=1 Tax=Pararge aegeria TaxID=116150 RepID=UPI0019D0C362|nr:uncharacterized protein LOC120636835 [Pararge aegeria]